jgi:hypothetical protein
MEKYIGPKRIGRRWLIAGSGSLLAAPSIVRAQGQSGVALVIGNSKYQWEDSLPNVRRDAPDVAKRFQELGLKTELLQDVGGNAMRAAIDKFKAAASGSNLAAFYFAGHGASWEKDTYLVPVDTDLSTPSVVKTLVPVPTVLAAMRAATHHLLVFDNCRNSPADGWQQLAAERAGAVYADRQRAAGADAGSNALTLYSTAPGRVALDGAPGGNSPFAAALLRQLGMPSIDLQALAPRLRRDLLIATEGRQVVWDQSTYQQPFQLNGSSRSSAPAGTPNDPSRIVEIKNAYAFAQKNGLPLPEGLIAYKRAVNSPHSQMVGAFEFTTQTPIGPRPFLFIVVSADDQGTAQLILAVQNDAGRLWRFSTGSISGSRLTFVANYGRPSFLIDWSDDNSGTVGALQGDNARNGAAGNKSAKVVRFTRLDG